MSGRPIAIVSGGLGDIGNAVARELARRFEADLALGDVRPEEDAAALCAELRASGRRVVYTRVDVADADAVAAWVRATEAAFGAPPDRIVPNAATVTVKPIDVISPAEWAREIGVNLSGGFHLAQAAARRLREAGLPGRIVFVGSWAADAVHPDLPAYCVSKAALRMLMRCMALEFAPAGIRVNEVAPGYVDAGLSRQMFEADPALRATAAAQVPGGELLSAAAVAEAVAYLCDPQNPHAVGSTLLIDGGLSLVTPGSRPHA